ncbi:hypothetical protein ACFX1R_021119 [Malus domestica]
MVEAAVNEVNCVSLVVEDLECVNSELRSACFAKDEELVFMHAEVSRLKNVTSKLESNEVDLQGALFPRENLKNEFGKLQDAHTRFVEENAQMKNEKVGIEVALASRQADFYKLGYVDHFQGKPLDYEFSEKDFETFSISLVDLLDFSFKAAFVGAVEGQAVQAEATEDELMEALAGKSGVVIEGVAIEEPMVIQAANE